MSNGKVHCSTRRGLWKSQRETLEQANSNMAVILEEAPKLNFQSFSLHFSLPHHKFFATATYSFHVDALHSRQNILTELKNNGNIQCTHFTNFKIELKKKKTCSRAHSNVCTRVADEWDGGRVIVSLVAL